MLGSLCVGVLEVRCSLSGAWVCSSHFDRNHDLRPPANKSLALALVTLESTFFGSVPPPAPGAVFFHAAWWSASW